MTLEGKRRVKNSNSAGGCRERLVIPVVESGERLEGKQQCLQVSRVKAGDDRGTKGTRRNGPYPSMVIHAESIIVWSIASSTESGDYDPDGFLNSKHRGLRCGRRRLSGDDVTVQSAHLGLTEDESSDRSRGMTMRRNANR